MRLVRRRAPGDDTRPPFAASLLRAVCLGIALMSVGLHLLAIPINFALIQQPCTTPDCLDNPTWLKPETIEAMVRLGVSTFTYAFVTIGLEAVVLCVSWCIAGLIFWRRRDPMAQLVGMMLAVGGFIGGGAGSVGEYYPALAVPGNMVSYLASLGLIIVFYLFPDGQFRPRWTRWLLLAVAITEFFYIFFPDAPWAPQNRLPLLEQTIWFGSFFAIIFVQISRYRSLSNAEQRRQTKWVVFGVATTIASLMGLVLTSMLLGETYSLLIPPLYGVATSIFSLFLPISFGIAMLRSGLFDIDVIIRRTLVYTMLTAALVIAYIGGVVAFQTLFRTVVGENSDLAVVASTLCIAGMFSPLRRMIQGFIDRRFYRTRYNAEKTLAAFHARLRDEVDLDVLSADITRVIEETMQPTHVSVWVKKEPVTTRRPN